MPTLYRIGCFRDDIIFLIYVYQRYKYRVDPTRVNEFGVSGEELAAQSDDPSLPNSSLPAIEENPDSENAESTEESKKDR